jgi:hypothetical protein
MEYKEAVAILINLLEKYSLKAKEKEAVLTSIGVLDLASIAKNSIKNRIKSQKAKKDKDAEG